MAPRSPARSSWADEVEAEEAAASHLRHLPPLAASACAAQVLRSSSLNPEAEPFDACPDSRGGRIFFTDSEAPSDEADQSPAAAVAARLRRLRRRRRRRPRCDVRRHRDPPAHSAIPPARRLASIVLHPVRLGGPRDSEGFTVVESRKRCRRPPSQRRPVPQMLNGRCFNCLALGHVRAVCTAPPACLACWQSGHRARDCLARRAPYKRGRSPDAAGRRRHAARRRRDYAGRRSYPTGTTVPGHSGTSPRAPTVPLVCAPPTPDAGAPQDADAPRPSDTAGRAADTAAAAADSQGARAPAMDAAAPGRAGRSRPPRSIRRRAAQRPDFLVRFVRREDLELVLGTPLPVEGQFILSWSRLPMAGDDSNHNFTHPGFSDGGGGSRPRSSSYGDRVDPGLDRPFRPTSRPARACSIRVGEVTCPVFPPRSAACRCALLCQCQPGGIPGAPSGFRLTGGVVAADPMELRGCSSSPVIVQSVGHTVAVAQRQTGQEHVTETASIDRCPRPPTSPPRAPNFVGRDLEAHFDLMVQLAGSLPNAAEPALDRAAVGGVMRDVPDLDLDPHAEIYLSGPETGGYEPSSPRAAATGVSSDVSPPRPPQDTPSSPAVATLADVGHRPGAGASPSTFVSSLVRPLDPPLLKTPKLRVTKAKDAAAVPKRSARLAAKSKFREPKPEAQARKVLMHKMGFVVPSSAQDEVSFDEFQLAFAQPLTPSKQEAVDVLFLGRMQRQDDVGAAA